MSLEDLKKSIRSLLTSTPNALTIDRLNSDFREFFGVNIPFQKFQYNSLEHFLKSNPDVCAVNGTGRFATITPCISEKAAHINEMVMRQKKTAPKGRNRPPRFQTRSGFNQFNRPPILKRPAGYSYAITPNASSNSSMMSSNSASSQRNFTPPTKQCWTVQNPIVQKSFQNQHNVFYNNKSDVSTQPTVIPKPLAPINNNTVSQVETIETTETTKKLDESRNNGWEAESSTENTQVATKSNNESENKHEDSLNISELVSSVSLNRKKHLEALIQKQIKLGNVTQSPSSSRPESQESFKSEMQLNFRPASQFSTRREAITILPATENNALDAQPVLDEEDKYMFTSKNLELFKPHLRNRHLDHRLPSYPSDAKPNEEFTEDKEISSNVPSHVQDRLKMLISQYEDGIWCADLPDLYRKQFRRELTFTEWSYHSLIEMCISLKHVFHYVRPGKDDFKLYDRTKPLPDTIEKTFTMASFAVKPQNEEPVTLDDGLPKRFCIEDFGYLAKDIFAQEGEIPREFLPEGTKVDSVFDIVVVEAYDPSKFWFYLGTSDKNTPLDGLMNEIQDFYAHPENKERYAIPPALIREGLYLVQIWFGEYHRAKVLEIIQEKEEVTMRVYFIDYGTVARTPVKGAMYLPMRFTELPAQAIRCRLSNVVPVNKGHPWPKEAAQFFRNSVNGRDTKMKITYIDWDEEYVVVFLADVTNPKKVAYINESLVKEGYALHDGEEQKVPFILPNYTPKVLNLHLFPTFLELECGLAPNASDMQHLELLQIPINFCIPQYFEWIDDYENDEELEVENHYNCFVETVRNNRKSLPWALPIRGEPYQFDFDIFGALADEMRDFKKQVDDQTHESFFDNPADVDYDVYVETFQNDETLEPITTTSIKQYSESILQECGGSPADIDFDNESEILEAELSMIMNDSVFSHDRGTPGSDAGFDANDVNIFDNPELFENERLSDSDYEEPTAAESFLRKVEKMVTPHSDIFSGSSSSHLLENHCSSRSQSDFCSAATSERSKSRESSVTSFFNKGSLDYNDGKKKTDYDSDSCDSTNLESFLDSMNLQLHAKRLERFRLSVDPAFQDESDTDRTEDTKEIHPKFASTNPFKSFLEHEKDEISVAKEDRVQESFIEKCSPDTTQITPTMQEFQESRKPFEFRVPEAPSSFKNSFSSKEDNPKTEEKICVEVTESNRLPGDISRDEPNRNRATGMTSSVGSTSSSIPSTCSTPNTTSTRISIPTQPGPQTQGYGPPPNQTFAPQPQGYAPPNQMFTHPNQSYGMSPQNQGYMPQNQSYMPQNQGYMPQNPYQQWSDGTGFSSVPQWSNANMGSPVNNTGAGNNQQTNVKPPPGFAPKSQTAFNPNAPSFNPNATTFNPSAPSFNPYNDPRFQQTPNVNPFAPTFVPYYQNCPPQNYINYVNQQRFSAAMQYQNAMFYQGTRLQTPALRPATPQGIDFYERFNQEKLKAGGGASSEENAGK